MISKFELYDDIQYKELTFENEEKLKKIIYDEIEDNNFIKTFISSMLK